LVALAILLQDGEGQLSQRFTHQIVDAGVQHIGNRVHPVAVEPLPSSEADGHGAVVVDPVAASISCFRFCTKPSTSWGGLRARHCCTGPDAPAASLNSRKRTMASKQKASG